MSFLGSIVSDISKAVTDPGALVSDAAKAILPKNMAAVGDLLGGIADIETGHPLQALSHLTGTLKDLPQLAQGQTAAPAKAASTPAGSAAAEPSPPPSRTNASAAGSASSTPAPTPQAPKVNVQMVGSETVISIDDGTHTTVIAEKPGQKPVVSVSTDRGPTTAPSPATPPSAPAPGTTPASPPASTTTPGTAPVTPPTSPAPASPPASTTAPGTPAGSTPSSPSGASTSSASSSASPPTPQSPKVTVQRIGRETITSIDNGTRTTVIVQRPGHPPVARTHGDTIAQLRANAAPPGKPETINAASPAPGAAAIANPAASTTAASNASTTTPAATSSANPASAAGGGASSSTSSATSTRDASTSATNGTSSSGSSAATPSDLQSLLKMSPDQFMQAVTSGKIPDSVANSQSAMMQVQARMNQITQMNQLVTGMMAAMHQMQMSIIQNIRC